MKTIIVAMSATDSVHIIRELQRLVTNDGRVEQHICALWANAIQPFGARGSAVLAELQGRLTVLSHSQSPLVGQTIPMPQFRIGHAVQSIGRRSDMRVIYNKFHDHSYIIFMQRLGRNQQQR
ncbi:hypothetical protein N8857_03475 [Planktomarina temperata]|nr:hypothetical protein [Planktomarina temperata]